MKTLSIPLADGEYELLADLALFLGFEKPEQMLRRSVNSWLGEERWKIREIEEARREAERGELVDDEDVWPEIDAILAQVDQVQIAAAE